MNFKTDPQARALSRYRDGLASLAGMKGQRNASLLGLVSLGIMAGLGDDRILCEVGAASGTPPLTDGEIKHALTTAHRDTVPLTDRPQSGRWTPPPGKPPPLGSGAASFVPRMIGKGRGATFATLSACSPVEIPTEPREQARVYLSTLYADGDLLFIGKQTNPGVIGETIRTAAEWRGLFSTSEPPPHVIANPLTGAEGMTKEGKPSFRCGACVAAYRFALLEFDDMPLDDQAAFWAGVIGAGTLPLRSLTYSGGKSIHALVDIGAADSVSWEKAIDTLLHATCHFSANKAHQSDRACRNPDRLPRLPGAVRPDKGTRQALLWLSKETAPRAPTIAPPLTHATTRTEPLPSPCVETGVNGAARCRDCWNWTPDGIKHGCRAGVKLRKSPDRREPCQRFDIVT